MSSSITCNDCSSQFIFSIAEPDAKPAAFNAFDMIDSDFEDEFNDAEIWEYKGRTYAKSADNVVWDMDEDGDIGQQVGVYNPLTDSIDLSS